MIFPLYAFRRISLPWYYEWGSSAQVKERLSTGETRKLCTWSVIIMIYNTNLFFFIQNYLHYLRYQIMLECWNENPRNRPSFAKIRAMFDTMLLAGRKEPYINLNFNADKAYYHTDEDNAPITTSFEHQSQLSLNCKPFQTPPSSNRSSIHTASMEHLPNAKSTTNKPRRSSSMSMLSEKQTGDKYADELFTLGVQKLHSCPNSSSQGDVCGSGSSIPT